MAIRVREVGDVSTEVDLGDMTAPFSAEDVVGLGLSLGVDLVLVQTSAAFQVTDVPATIVDANWSVATGATLGGQLDVSIANLPAANGATITDIEYDLGASGTWVSSGGTVGFSITGLTAASSFAVRLRAVNAAGSGLPGNSESATSSAAAAASSTQPAVLGTGGVLSGTVAAGETFTDALPSAGDYFVLIAVLNNGTSAKNLALTAELGTVTDIAGDGQNGDDTTIGFWHVAATAQSDISFTAANPIFNATRVFILDANDASSTLRTSAYKQQPDQSDANESIAQVLTGLTLGDFVVSMCAHRNDTPTHTWGGDMATGEITTVGFSVHRYSVCVQTVDATNDSPDNFDISVTAAILGVRTSLGTFVAIPT